MRRPCASSTRSAGCPSRRHILERIVRAERAYPDVPTEVMLELEEDLHVSCVLSVENARLASFIQQSQLPLLVSHLFHRYLGTPKDGRMLAEHRLVVEHLVFGPPTRRRRCPLISTRHCCAASAACKCWR